MAQSELQGISRQRHGHVTTDKQESGRTTPTHVVHIISRRGPGSVSHNELSGKKLLRREIHTNGKANEQNTEAVATETGINWNCFCLNSKDLT